MKPSILTPGVLVCAALSLFADTRSDILELTGNARTKLVWVRFPWCDSTYTPVQAFKSDNSLGNSGPNTQLMAFDTDEGVQRYLDEQLDFHTVPRITRRDGSHVIWSDKGNSCSWIRDHAGKTPKRKLLTKGDYTVVHCRYDATSGKEYIYTLSDDGKRLSMMTLKSDYTADTTTRTLVYTATDKMKTSLGISADGRYLGTHVPWPQTRIIDMQSNQVYPRHVSEPFGCEPNLAPDNSYRFFYHSSGHDTVRMWGPALSTTMWHVPVNKGLPGAGTKYFDTMGPRWSNQVRFFTISYPLLFGFEVNWNMLDVFRMSAAQMKAEDPAKAGTFLLGKFSSDYQTVEKYVNVSGTDIRRRDVVGDAWIADVPSGARTRKPTSVEDRQPKVTIRGSAIEVGFAEGSIGIVTLTNAKGVSVARVTAMGRALMNKVPLPAGLYILTLRTEGEISTTRILMGPSELRTR